MELLDNRLVAPYFPRAYYLAMKNESFQDRVKAAMAEQKINKAELSRRSKVPYHAIDKFLKRENASTSADNAKAMSNSLGINIDDDRAYEELRELFYQLDEDSRKFLIKSAKGLIG